MKYDLRQCERPAYDFSTPRRVAFFCLRRQRPEDTNRQQPLRSARINQKRRTGLYSTRRTLCKTAEHVMSGDYFIDAMLTCSRKRT